MSQNFHQQISQITQTIGFKSAESSQSLIDYGSNQYKVSDFGENSTF